MLQGEGGKDGRKISDGVGDEWRSGEEKKDKGKKTGDDAGTLEAGNV